MPAIVTPSRRFAIALSFPGEHRRYVRRVAEQLRIELNQERVFFDEWYEAEIRGVDADLKLKRIYREHSAVVVPFFSKHYRKKWCQVEWSAIRVVLAERRQDNSIIPVHMDDTPIEGWESIDLGIPKKRKSAAQIAKELLAFYHRLMAPLTPDVIREERHRRRDAAERRNEIARAKLSSLTPPERVVLERDFGHGSLLIINDDICNATTDVIVSSDDNHFTARGGVSKALQGRLGKGVRRQLDAYSKRGFRQSQVAITTGGKWNRRAIIHAAVIDLDENRYPTPEVIRLLTQRSLACAAALGARSIAFPVLGGGYGTACMRASDSVGVITREIATYLSEDRDHGELVRAILYIYNPEDNSGLPREITTP